MSCSVKNLGGGTELIKEETFTLSQYQTEIEDWINYNDFIKILKTYKTICAKVSAWDTRYSDDYIIQFCSASGNYNTHDIYCVTMLDAIEEIKVYGRGDYSKFEPNGFYGRLGPRSSGSNAHDIQFMAYFPFTKTMINANKGMKIQIYESSYGSTVNCKFSLYGTK